MLSGTGIRDSVEGGYVDPSMLGLSERLKSQIRLWLDRYADAHFSQFKDSQIVAALDAEGLVIAEQLRDELPGSKIVYFSDAEMREISKPY
jgi:hypothetical protein